MALFRCRCHTVAESGRKEREGPVSTHQKKSEQETENGYVTHSDPFRVCTGILESVLAVPL